MRQVVKESSAFYLLGYSSVKNPADGRFHEIKVKVEQPGLDVRARHGYWAPSAKAIDDARTAAAAATPPTPVATALVALTSASSRHVLDLWTGVERGRDGRPALPWRGGPVRECQRRSGGGEGGGHGHCRGTGVSVRWHRR